jgi:MYXO-CTERM domain-containing protein
MLCPRLLAATLLTSTLVFDGCGPLGGAGEVDDGSRRGELRIYVSDDFTGRSETRYALAEPGGAERPLLFEAPPAFAPGTALRVWGVDTPEGFHVARADALAPEVNEVTSALRAAPPMASRSFAFVLIDMGMGVNTTPAEAMDRLVGAPDSIRNYFLGDSFGAQDVTAQVFGPIRYTLENGCGTFQLASDLRAVIPGTFQHYLWYFGTRQDACPWTGLASVGTRANPSRDTWYNASTGCVVLVQEPEHNIDMQHSSSLQCPGAMFADDPNECTSSEYGDPFDPMGGGCRHMNAWQKDYQGWFGACNGVTVQSSGAFTLLPMEQACDGIQYLKVVATRPRTFNRPAGGGSGPSVETLSHYYVELRTPRDFDGVLGNTAPLAPQVLIHVGGDTAGPTQGGLHTYLLDATPATTGRAGLADAALGAGKTFSDPAGGLTITVAAVSAAQATIVVQMPFGSGGPTCIDGSPFTAPGPGPESCNALPLLDDAGVTVALADGGEAGAIDGEGGMDEAGSGETSPEADGETTTDAESLPEAASAVLDTPSAKDASDDVGAPSPTGDAGLVATAATADRAGQGCGCSSGGAPSGALGALAVGLAMGATRRRRRSDSRGPTPAA